MAILCRTFTGTPFLYSGHNTMADELPSYRFIRPNWLARGLAACWIPLSPAAGSLFAAQHKHRELLPRPRRLQPARTEPIVNFGIDVDWVAGAPAAMRPRCDSVMAWVMIP